MNWFPIYARYSNFLFIYFSLNWTKNSRVTIFFSLTLSLFGDDNDVIVVIQLNYRLLFIIFMLSLFLDVITYTMWENERVDGINFYYGFCRFKMLLKWNQFINWLFLQELQVFLYERRRDAIYSRCEIELFFNRLNSVCLSVYQSDACVFVSHNFCADKCRSKW